MKKRKISPHICCLLLLCCCWSTACFSQQYVSNPVAQYYRNGYLWNPAYAGSNDHPTFYALLNNSWIGFEGAPTLVMFTADKSFGKASGAGLKLVSDKSGMLWRTSVTADYSYTLHFSNSERLRMGISGGIYMERLSGDGNALADPSIYGYNDANNTSFDASLGAVYEHGGFSIGGSLYNLNSGYFQKSKNQVDVARASFVSSYSILVTSGDSTFIKPLIGYKIYSASEGLFTAGVQMESGKFFNAAFIWQSAGNVIGSIGLRIDHAAEINFSYSSNNKYGYGQLWEVGLGIGLH
jgi:type IX secretion system PorP/SprF family membrane protein